MAINEREMLGRLTKPNLWQTPLNREMPINVSQPERIASGLGGAVLTFYGLRHNNPFGWALTALGSDLVYRGLTGHCSVYQAFKINTARQGGNPNAAVRANTAIKVKRSMTINKSPEELYRFWRNFENLPKFMEHLEAVTVQDEKRSHWVAKAPAGTKVEWDAEVYTEKENELISWRSLPGANVPNAGSVQFRPAPGNRGTEVLVELDYQPPAGVIGAAIAKLFGEEPQQTVQEDLRHLKMMMESGEVVTVKGQPSCREK